MARRPNRWSAWEDDVLRREVAAQSDKINWCTVAERLPLRSNKDCRKRWLNVVSEGLKKGPWTKKEDDLLLQGIREFDQSWTKISRLVETRNADQCAKRWQQSLDPNLDRSEWNCIDNMVLLNAVSKYGRQWKIIQSGIFPLRSKNSLKNQYTILSRKRKRTHVEPSSSCRAITRGDSITNDLMTTDVTNEQYLGNTPAPCFYPLSTQSFSEPMKPYQGASSASGGDPNVEDAELKSVSFTTPFGDIDMFNNQFDLPTTISAWPDTASSSSNGMAVNIDMDFANSAMLATDNSNFSRLFGYSSTPQTQPCAKLSTFDSAIHGTLYDAENSSQDIASLDIATSLYTELTQPPLHSHTNISHSVGNHSSGITHGISSFYPDVFADPCMLDLDAFFRL